MPTAKLSDYVLNPAHSQGGPKARVRTGWILPFDDDRPHLTTAYVDR